MATRDKKSLQNIMNKWTSESAKYATRKYSILFSSFRQQNDEVHRGEAVVP